MTDLLALHLSPREKGNSEILLDEFLRGAREAGANVKTVYCRDLEVQGCVECGGCDDTGECVLSDDMNDLYPDLIAAERIVVAGSIFFYGLPAQGKAIVDRSQALWSRVRLDPDLKRPQGRGFFLGVGATKGKNLFDGAILCVKYFMDAIGLPLDMDVLTYRQVEAKGAIKNHPTALREAFEAGKAFVTGPS